MLGQWPQAERPLLEAAIRAPDFWETSNNLGALYTRLKAWEAAAFAYRSVLMLNPGYPLAQQRFRESWIHFQQARRATS
jgi:Flp pilus assembly protein TadD